MVCNVISRESLACELLPSSPPEIELRIDFLLGKEKKTWREFLLLLLFYGLFKILSEVVIWAKVALYNLQKLHYDMPKG